MDGTQNEGPWLRRIDRKDETERRKLLILQRDWQPRESHHPVRKMMKDHFTLPGRQRKRPRSRSRFLSSKERRSLLIKSAKWKSNFTLTSSASVTYELKIVKRDDNNHGRC